MKGEILFAPSQLNVNIDVVLLTLRQCMKKSVIKSVPVSGSNLILPNIIFNIKCNRDMTISKVEITMNGARNDRSFLRKPIMTRIEDKTPKQENPKYVTLNHNVTNKKNQ